ncbi:DUF5610 domain-containing protein [Ectothiorhodospira variabilis]|uniref:DUF5610 domain-containing protein n=1 Tax=Ectothiorhodospira variabilis TaxID=505694 RepID=UPI001EFA98BE|nr:DUF5610 domain-containing protein [Ectothiorhodospira variabilis]MCG5498092.1 DUF5610 domain-containing protein [Ectothiorhodospira variabilis]MCG5503681.1 DUF5610 domain-containing protein [Ectothiorhodospira variabilis]MCG5506837.1 DUF5610 domain-containing protein [Ectothiorhodospira variabilis]
MAIDNSSFPVSLKTPDFRPGARGAGQGLAAGDNGSARSLNALQNKILENLARQIPGQSASSMKRLDANDFTPEKVAERIAGFVELGLANARARGASEEQLENLRQQATRGVEQGFKEAREILGGLNLLDGKIKADVDETERLTFDALENLKRAPQDRDLAGVTRLSMMERYQRAESLELNITTQSGAQVSIQFQSAQDTRVQAEARMEGGESRGWLDVSRSEQSGYRFSVQGDLNPDELQAIENLVRDVGQLADEFFNGDVQRAFEMLPDLRFDTSQLQSMDLNMTRTETYKMAQSYEQTRQMESPEQSMPGRRIGQLMEAMQERFNQPSLQFLANPMDDGGLIMKTLVEQDTRFKEAATEQQERFQENMARLLDAVRQ